MATRQPPREHGEKPDDAGGGDEPREEGGARGHSPSSEVPEVLRGRSPREILARLVEGDPLEIEARCRERIETLALLVDLQRLHLRTAARVAHAAPSWRGEPPISEWLADRIEVSMRELIREDFEAERSGIPPEKPWDPRYAFVSEALGVEPALARRACVAFNKLPLEVRCVYFAVAVQGKTVNRHVAEGHGPPEKARAQLKMAVQAISKAIGRPLGGEGGLHGWA